MEKDFANKVIIVTGSTKGIGKAFAEFAGRNQSLIVINGRNADALQKTKSEFIKKGYSVLAVKADITDGDECRHLIETTIAHFGKLDMLINNAGVNCRSLLKNIRPDVLQYVFNLNTIAPIILSQLAIPYLQKTHGSIVFISSIAGLIGIPQLSIYSSSKMALTAIAQTMHTELKGDNIYVGIVYVGMAEIDEDKYALNAEGIHQKLQKRKGYFVVSMHQVVQAIAMNITRQTLYSYSGLSSHFFGILIRFFPVLTKWIIAITYKKMQSLYK